MIEVVVLVSSEFLEREPAGHVSALHRDRTLSEAAPDVRHASGRLARSLLVVRRRHGRRASSQHRGLDGIVRVTSKWPTLEVFSVRFNTLRGRMFRRGIGCWVVLHKNMG